MHGAALHTRSLVVLTAAAAPRARQALERAFWRQLPYRPPVYGADVEGSLFDPGVPWSIAKMDTILRCARAAIASGSVAS